MYCQSDTEKEQVGNDLSQFSTKISNNIDDNDNNDDEDNRKSDDEVNSKNFTLFETT